MECRRAAIGHPKVLPGQLGPVEGVWANMKVGLANVIRTRVMLTDISRWREAAHAQRFAQVQPACTFIEVSRFIDPEWLVEFEVDAIVPD